MSWQGMNETTGRHITELEHIRQSARDILTTPVGSRLMRRDYGSDLFQLIDQPQNGATRLRLMSATVMALLRWEPRIQISSINITNDGMTGALVITISGQRIDDQRRNLSFSIEVTK